MTKATKNDLFAIASSRSLAPAMVLRFHYTVSPFSAISLRLFTMAGKSAAKFSTAVRLYRGNAVLEIIYSKLKKIDFRASRIWFDEKAFLFVLS